MTDVMPGAAIPAPPGYCPRLDSYRAWLLALAMLAASGDPARAQALYDRWCAEHCV